MICIFYFSSLTVAQMTDILVGSYIRVYGKSWLCSFFKESVDMFLLWNHGSGIYWLLQNKCNLTF